MDWNELKASRAAKQKQLSNVQTLPRREREKTAKLTDENQRLSRCICENGVGKVSKREEW